MRGRSPPRQALSLLSQSHRTGTGAGAVSRRRVYYAGVAARCRPFHMRTMHIYHANSTLSGHILRPFLCHNCPQYPVAGLYVYISEGLPTVAAADCPAARYRFAPNSAAVRTTKRMTDGSSSASRSVTATANEGEIALSETRAQQKKGAGRAVVRCRQPPETQAVVAYPPYIYGLHEPGGEHLMREAGRIGWVLHPRRRRPRRHTGVCRLSQPRRSGLRHHHA